MRKVHSGCKDTIIYGIHKKVFKYVTRHLSPVIHVPFFLPASRSLFIFFGIREDQSGGKNLSQLASYNQSFIDSQSSDIRLLTSSTYTQKIF